MISGVPWNFRWEGIHVFYKKRPDLIALKHTKLYSYTKKYIKIALHVKIQVI